MHLRFFWTAKWFVSPLGAFISIDSSDDDGANQKPQKKLKKFPDGCQQNLRNNARVGGVPNNECMAQKAGREVGLLGHKKPFLRAGKGQNRTINRQNT
jgi:hypothetical protein